MMDLDKPVTIKHDQKKKTYTPKRSIATMIENLEVYNDDYYLFPVKLTFEN